MTSNRSIGHNPFNQPQTFDVEQGQPSSTASRSSGRQITIGEDQVVLSNSRLPRLHRPQWLKRPTLKQVVMGGVGAAFVASVGTNIGLGAKNYSLKNTNENLRAQLNQLPDFTQDELSTTPGFGEGVAAAPFAEDIVAASPYAASPYAAGPYSVDQSAELDINDGTDLDTVFESMPTQGYTTPFTDLVFLRKAWSTGAYSAGDNFVENAWVDPETGLTFQPISTPLFAPDQQDLAEMADFAGEAAAPGQAPAAAPTQYVALEPSIADVVADAGVCAGSLVGADSTQDWAAVAKALAYSSPQFTKQLLSPAPNLDTSSLLNNGTSYSVTAFFKTAAQPNHFQGLEFEQSNVVAVTSSPDTATYVWGTNSEKPAAWYPLVRAFLGQMLDNGADVYDASGALALLTGRESSPIDLDVDNFDEHVADLVNNGQTGIYRASSFANLSQYEGFDPETQSIRAGACTITKVFGDAAAHVKSDDGSTDEIVFANDRPYVFTTASSQETSLTGNASVEEEIGAGETVSNAAIVTGPVQQVVINDIAESTIDVPSLQSQLLSGEGALNPWDGAFESSGSPQADVENLATLPVKTGGSMSLPVEAFRVLFSGGSLVKIPNLDNVAQQDESLFG